MWQRLFVCSQQRLEANKTTLSNELIRLVLAPALPNTRKFGGYAGTRVGDAQNPVLVTQARDSSFFCTHCITRCSEHSSVVYSGYACERSDVTTSLVRTRTHRVPGRPTFSCILQSLHTSVLRMIPMDFLFNVTLCYDNSCTRAMGFILIFCCDRVFM